MTNRITIALDKETYDLTEKMKKEMQISQSEMFRRALRFYYENRSFINPLSRMKFHFYKDLLLSGEHIILDIDHWILLLETIASSSDQNLFWEKCKDVARAHAEQLKYNVSSLQDILERLEACNFFKLIKNSQNDFTLVLGSKITMKFIKTFLEEFISALGYNAEIKEDIAKIRIKLTK